MDPSAQLLRFTRLSERLKLELRHSWISNGRRESVAEPQSQLAGQEPLLGDAVQRAWR